MNQLARQAFDINQANLSLGCEVFQAEGATFVRRRDFPNIRDVNRVTWVEAESAAQIERLLERVETEFEHANELTFHLGLEPSPMIEARLLLDGFGPGSNELIMVLDGPLLADSRPLRIEPIIDEAGWQAFAELNRLEFAEFVDKMGRDEELDVADQLAAIAKDRSPPVRYWLAYLDDAPRGFFSSWAGIDGMGQVEDLFVHPDFRHRGIATALIAHCVDDCRSHGANRIVIVCAAGDTPKNMYAALGFQPVAVKRAYRKSRNL